jgi:hypothetical protein
MEMRVSRKSDANAPSGKWVQRVPRSLHAKLILLARAEGVSMNHLVIAALSEWIGANTVRGCFAGDKDDEQGERVAPVDQ